MRKGYSDSDLPSRENESFLVYLHRLAQHQGYLPADAQPPSDRKRPKRQGQPGFMERLDAIFGAKRAEILTGELHGEPVEKA